MSSVPYQALNETVSLEKRHLSAEVQDCSASGTLRMRGSKRLRLVFQEPGLEGPEHRIAILAEKGCRSCYSQTYHPFTILSNGKRQTVWLNEKSLVARFNVSKRLLERAVSNDDLMRIVRYKLLEPHLTSVQMREGNFHFSAKDYSLKEGVYVNPEIVAFGVKNSEIGSGGSATVKKARTPQGELLARRICVITEKNEKRVRYMLRCLREFNGKPGVIDLRGVVEYVNSKGVRKIVTFHTLFDGDLFSALFKKKESIPEELRFSWADQILIGLQSLGGAHGDLKPENILIKVTLLALCDPEFYRRKKEKGTFCKGTLHWAPPEVLKGGKKVVTEKLDVWPLGVIFYYLLAKSFPKTLPWQTEDTTRKTLAAMQQEKIDALITSSSFSEKVSALLSHMLVVNVEDRWTIDEVIEYFQKQLKST